MHLEVKCKACGYNFLCNPLTARIKGPIITVTCPKCDSESSRNLSAFTGSFFEKEEVKLLEKTIGMLNLVQDIASEIGQDTAFGKKKKVDKKDE